MTAITLLSSCVDQKQKELKQNFDYSITQSDNNNDSTKHENYDTLTFEITKGLDLKVRKHYDDSLNTYIYVVENLDFDRYHGKFWEFWENVFLDAWFSKNKLPQEIIFNDLVIQNWKKILWEIRFNPNIDNNIDDNKQDFTEILPSQIDSMTNDLPDGEYTAIQLIK